MPRTLRSAAISFGLVTIPVNLYSAISEQDVHFHQVHDKCGSRIKQQLYCPVCERVVERSELVKGYELSKDQLVKVTQDELDHLEAAQSDSIEILNFVPLSAVDPIFYEDSFYLGPDKRGEKPYHLLAQAMEETQRVALAKFVWRGKENLYLLRPFQHGLILHRMYYSDEVRSFDDIQKGEAKVSKVSDEEMKLAMQLIESISQSEFKPEAYHDDYRQRVIDMLESKAKGKEIKMPAKSRPAPVLDIMQKLRESLQKTQKTGTGATALPARTGASRKRAHAGRK